MNECEYKSTDCFLGRMDFLIKHNHFAKNIQTRQKAFFVRKFAEIITTTLEYQ